jgi:hypothetical protein
MALFYVLMSVVGIGLVALGTSLIATARPGWVVLNRRNRGVPASARWNGAAIVAVGCAWLVLTWVLPSGSSAASLVVALMFLALVVCLFMAARITRHT